MRRSLDERRPEKITGIHMANDFAIGEGIKDAAEGKKDTNFNLKRRETECFKV